MTVSENFRSVNERIEAALKRSGREGDKVTLIAVTKTHPPALMNEAIQAGASDIGENKPQEVRDKFDEVLPNVKWHLIGHLQTNKIKYIIDKVSLIHSVDSIHLMDEIDRQAKKNNLIMDILIQVNISGEASKSGIDKSELDELLLHAGDLDNIKVRGLMTIAPIDGDPSVHFINMKKLFDEYKSKELKNVSLEHLSMGMSNDFEQAIECGATMVRVGSAIFGKRNYNI